MNVICSWSGGKDSCFALMKAMHAGAKPKVLLNMMNENNKVSRSHGLSLKILKQQASALDLPIVTVPTTWSNYETNYLKTLIKLKDQYQLEGAVFGDIDIETNRAWEEKVSEAAGLQAILPLWKQPRVKLFRSMIHNGLEAIITSCNTALGERFLARSISEDLMSELSKLEVDICGENGEYHTALIDCPIFKAPIQLPQYQKVTYKHYCFLTW